MKTLSIFGLLLISMICVGCASDPLALRETEQAWQARKEDKRPVVSDATYNDLPAVVEDADYATMTDAEKTRPDGKPRCISRSMHDAKPLDREQVLPKSLDDSRNFERDQALKRQRGK